MTIDMPRLFQENDAGLKEWKRFIEGLAPSDWDNPGLSFRHRDLIYGLENAVAAFLRPESSYHQDGSLLPLAESGARILLKSLNEDGTCNSVNMASPPDTGFITERVGAVMVLLNSVEEERSETDVLYQLLEEYLVRTCDALLSGGIHTPNHRWVVSSALSYGFALLGRQEYKARAEAWLEEGVDLDADGQFSERSVSIYSPVTVHCLLNMAEYLDRPDLLPIVRKNLDLTLLHFNPEGRLITLASRRQDVFQEGRSGRYYLPYLIMAGRDSRREYAEAASFIQQKERFLSGLTEILSGRVTEPLPEPSRSLPVPGERFIPLSGLFRSWEKGRFYTVFGGCDDLGGPASGLSTSPDFFSFRGGACRLESLRIASQFFSTGYFRGESIQYERGRCVVSQSRQVPYFDCLDRGSFHPGGEYSLTSSGRYWSKMNFPARKQVNTQKLDIQAVVEKREENILLEIRAGGCPHVPVALEFRFPGEGCLEGVWDDPSEGTALFGRGYKPRPGNMKILKDGYAVYSHRGDLLRIGPGCCRHDWLPYQQMQNFFPLEQDHEEKQFVYLTLYSPFRITLTVESTLSPKQI